MKNNRYLATSRFWGKFFGVVKFRQKRLLIMETQLKLTIIIIFFYYYNLFSSVPFKYVICQRPGALFAWLSTGKIDEREKKDVSKDGFRLNHTRCDEYEF